MARTCAARPLTDWLPGFDPEAIDPAPTPSYVDLFNPAPKDCAPSLEAPVPDVISTEVPEEAAPTAMPAAWRMAMPTESAPNKPSPWAPVTARHLDGLRSPVAKFDSNVAAIELLQRLAREDRAATLDERSTLLRFTGLGGIPAAFNHEGADATWSARASRLVDLLDAEDHASALASVNSSHYTEIHVIEAMWQAAQRFGFQGGRVLEPAAGVGHFIGAMPTTLVERCQVTAVELDRMAGRLLQALYAPHGVDVRIGAFEKVPLPESWFDLVIGNVPFGNYKVADTSQRAYTRFSIHNYFFGRALDLLRPGGLVCLITSSHTMESQTDHVREYLAAQAELLGAIRLPAGAFAGMAGTEVQTDILFMRKRERGEQTRTDWVSRTLVPEPLRDRRCSDRYPQINAWYAKQPQLCIGLITYRSNGYNEIPTAVFEGDLEAALLERIELLPEGVYRAAATATAPQVKALVPTDPGARPGSYRVHLGRIHRVAAQGMADVHDELNATQRSRIVGLCAIRDHARALLDAQLAQDDDGQLGHLRAMLNGTYDRFVARHGCLSNRANALAFRRDPDYPLLLSLEHYDEEADTARKADVFTQRTLRRVIAPASAGDPTEALAASMQWRGRVDPAYMAGLLQASEDEVMAALANAGLVYMNPAQRRWETADEYLSGNVKAKLKQALLSGTDCARNVQALQRVQPEDLPPASIEPRLGAVWIPAADIEVSAPIQY